VQPVIINLFESQKRMEDSYEDESFSSESYGDDFDAELDDQDTPKKSSSSPVKTMRGIELTEKVMSIDALGDLMGHLDEQLAQGGSALKNGDGSFQSPQTSPPKAGASSSPLKHTGEH
jgi:hypothetical protein